jgi:hypothetical protein
MVHNVYRYAQRLSLTRTHNLVKNVCVVGNTPRGTIVNIVTIPLSAVYVAVRGRFLYVIKANWQ